MEQLLERARAYLDALEAERQMALTLSEQKAEEAKLIKARQEGFRAAIEMLGSEIATGNAGTDPQRKEPVRRRARRPIREMILRELSFSGQPMTRAQIARVINYLPERTQTALERMEEDGQVQRNDGRWAIRATSLTHMNAVSATTANPKSRRPRSEHQIIHQPQSTGPSAPSVIQANPRPGLSAADLTALLQFGDSLLLTGDVVSARLFYEQAAAARDGRAALRFGATGRLAPFTGRDRSIDELRTVLDRPSVRAVVVTGPHMIGKSRLILEATRRRRSSRRSMPAASTATACAG